MLSDGASRLVGARRLGVRLAAPASAIDAKK
jgi:hypothetical protein